MITFKDINKSYDNKRVLNEINVTFNDGEITTIVGQSGCGKSTLLKLINKIILPDSGDIFIYDESIKDLDDIKLRRSIGYAIQGIGLFPHMTVKGNIATVPKLLKWKKKAIDERIDFLMDMVNLPRTYLNKYPSQLSGGEAQRVGVARALAADPDILLMDEPFGALDPITRKKLQDALLNIQEKLKKTILFVTHDVNEALVLADSLVLMKDQKIIIKDSPYNIIQTSKELLKTFTGGSFAIEFLEKYKLERLCLSDNKVSNGSYDFYLNKDISLKEALSDLILEGRQDLYIKIDKETFKVDITMITGFLRWKYD